MRKVRILRDALQYHMGLHSAKPTLSCKAGSFSRTLRRRYCMSTPKGKQSAHLFLYAAPAACELRRAIFVVAQLRVSVPSAWQDEFVQERTKFYVVRAQ